jgi:magnesium-transporting ATPase (P-type)
VTELTAKQRPVFIVVGLIIFAVWVLSAVLFFNVFSEKLSLQESGYGKIIAIIIGLLVIIAITIKFKFLKPKTKKLPIPIQILNALSQIAILFAIMLAGSITIHLCLAHDSLTKVFNEGIALVCLIALVVLTKKIIIPTIVVDLQQREFSAASKAKLSSSKFK